MRELSKNSVMQTFAFSSPHGIGTNNSTIQIPLVSIPLESLPFIRRPRRSDLTSNKSAYEDDSTQA